MASAATIERPGTDIVAMVEANPVMVLTDREQFNRFYEEIKRETDALEVDLTTETGRKKIASMAFKVAQTKTTIDKAGKLLNEEARQRINAVDAARREIWDQLESLQKEVSATLEKLKDAQERQARRMREEAAAEARREAELTAQQLAEEKDRKHAQEVARLKKEADDAQRKRDEEAAASARQAEESRKLEANKAHRNRVKTAAKDALITCGADEDTARKIVIAIIAGEIPAVSINFGSDRS